MYCTNCNKNGVYFSFWRKGCFIKLFLKQNIDKNILSHCKAISKMYNYCGICDILDNTFIGHFVCDNELYIRINNEIFLFSRISFKYEKLFNNVVLTINIENNNLIILKYKFISNIKGIIDIFDIFTTNRNRKEFLDYGFFLYSLSEKSKNIIIDAYMKYERKVRPYAVNP